VQPASGPEEAVLQELSGQAALKIDDQRQAKQLGRRPSHRYSLVQVSMNDIRSISLTGPQNGQGQQWINVELV
jgi:hypothetical protein